MPVYDVVLLEMEGNAKRILMLSFFSFTKETSALNRFRHGFNLIEAAIVLAIVGFVIGGIWVAAAAVSERQRIAETAKGILTICDKASALYSASMPPSGVTDIRTSIKTSGVLPASWVQGGNFVTPVGHLGFVWWMDASQGAQYEGEVRVNLNGLTPSQCMQLLPKVSGTNPNILRMIRVGVGSDSGTWTTVTNFSLPYHGSFTSECNSGSSILISFYCTARRR